MKRAVLFAVGGLNIGCVVIQTVMLIAEVATHASVSRSAVTMAFLIANAAAAGWAFGRALEVRP